MIWRACGSDGRLSAFAMSAIFQKSKDESEVGWEEIEKRDDDDGRFVS